MTYVALLPKQLNHLCYGNSDGTTKWVDRAEIK